MRKRRRQRRLRLEPLEDRRLLAADFMIGTLPDTQHYAGAHPEIYNAQTQWLADNAQSANIEFVSHLGDVVERASTTSEWQNADAAMRILDGDLVSNPDGIVPYSVVPGNHDYDNSNNHSSGSEFINYFGPSRYAGRSWYGGASPDQLSHYQIFNAGEYQFLHIGLEWEPRATAITWAQSVLDANPGLPAIVTTHAYIYKSGGRFVGATNADGLDGEELFQQLIAPNPQIFMVMGGHFTGERHEVSLNNSGTEVFEILADYQGRENGGNGWMQLLNFRPDLDRIDVTTYSPWLDAYETDANSQFSLDIDFDQRFGISSIPSVQLSAPIDNGVYDSNPAVGTVAYGSPLASIDLQLTDLSPGIDDATVTEATITLSKNGVPLNESLDFDFSYDAAIDRIRLSPVGAFFDNGQYAVTVSAGPSKIADLNGAEVAASSFDLVVDTTLGNSPDELYFSMRSAGSLSTGFSYSSNDILYFDGANASRFIDGSDVGLGSLVIDGFAMLSENEVLLSFTSSSSLPGIAGSADDSDIVKFTGTQFGENTTGSFELYLDGSDIDLTSSGEDIDAISLLPNGNLLVSTSGSFTVGSLSGSDEDLLEFAPTSLGTTTGGSWTVYIDSSDVALSGDVNAVSVAKNGDVYMSNSSSITLDDVSIKDDDVFAFSPSLLGSDTSGTFVFPIYLDGSNFGLSPSDIYGIDLPDFGPVVTNSAPIAANDTVFINEDTAISVDVLLDNGGGIDSDSDGVLVPSSVAIVSQATNGIVSNNGDGSLQYAPAMNFFGADSFTYIVQDDQGVASNVATVTVNVVGVNDLPLAVDDLVDVATNTALTIEVLKDNGNGVDSDIDGVLIASSVAIGNNVANGSLVNNGDGTFLYTAAVDFSGADSFTYSVQDDQGGSSNFATVFITVSQPNDSPIAVDDIAATNEDTAITINVLIDNGNGADVDSDGSIVAATVAETGQPAYGLLVNNGDGTFLYTPSANFFGSDTFNYTVEDDQGAESNIATVAITVSGVNDAPVARDDSLITVKDTPLLIDVLIDNGGGADADVDGTISPASAAAISGPANGALHNNGDGTFSYTPNTGFVGDDSFVYTVADNNNTASNPATVSISVIESSSSTFYFSLSSTATINAQVTAANEDIVVFDGTDFSHFFDGSDVGLSSKALAGFAVINSQELLLAFSSTVTIPGIPQTVTQHDIVKFTATQLGSATAGVFQLYFDGSDVGLSGSSGKLDAVDLLSDGRLVLSTTGSVTLGGVSVRDEDLLSFVPTTTGLDTAGTWSLYFDSSDVGFSSEDIDAVAVGIDGRIYFSAQTAFALPELSGDDEDVIAFTPATLGEATTGVVDSTLHFDGSNIDIVSSDVRGIDIVDGISPLLAEQSTTTVSGSHSLPSLSPSQADAIVQAAIALWQAAAPQVSVPDPSVRVANLPGDWLAMVQADTITFDINAAGHGWFVDSTPDRNEEFSLVPGSDTLRAGLNSPAADHYDLLTVAAHEIGHMLGLEHAVAGGLMGVKLSLGTRHQPMPISQIKIGTKGSETRDVGTQDGTSRPTQPGSENDQRTGRRGRRSGVARRNARSMRQRKAAHRRNRRGLLTVNDAEASSNSDARSIVFADFDVLNDVLASVS